MVVIDCTTYSGSADSFLLLALLIADGTLINSSSTFSTENIMTAGWNEGGGASTPAESGR